MDVNEQFKAEKEGQIAQLRAIVERNQAAIAGYDSGAAQAEIDMKLDQDIADGKIRMLDGNRYLVLEGWDRNEIFSVQRATRPAEIPLILPESNLDTSTGTAALYTRQPEWHALGNVVPEGVSDIDEVLNLGGINWGVETRPVHYYADGEIRDVPGKFVTVRDDTWAPLGVVGNVYTPVQNREGFQFLQDLTESNDAIWETAGALYGGRRVFVSMQLPESVIIDAEGINDEVRKYVAVINSHDGISPFRCVATPWRIACGNTERFAMRDAYAQWSVRHCKTATQRIAEARRTMGLSLKYYDKFAEEETRLARTDITIDQVQELLASLWPVEEDAGKMKVAKAAKRSEQILELVAKEKEQVGLTAYAAERAVTDYLDHQVTRRTSGAWLDLVPAVKGDKMAAARATAILEGASDDVKSKAHAKLMLLAK